jgi:Zn-dependent protease with chaperone function
MAKKILPIALVSLLAGAAALLTLRKGSPTRESLLPVLRTAQQHAKQLDRAGGLILPMSPEEERRIGRDLDSRLAGAPLPPGPIPAMARRLGSAPLVVRFRGRYEFRTLPGQASVNAFALPGGFVYLLGGLTRRFAPDPDALAFVIAHEIGHVELGHCADAFRGGNWLDKAGLGALKGPERVLRVLAQLEFSETQELEADSFAVRLLRSVGRDPAAGLRALDLLGLAEDADRATKRGPGKVALEGAADYLRTHPGGWERRNNLRHEMERSGKAG